MNINIGIGKNMKNKPLKLLKEAYEIILATRSDDREQFEKNLKFLNKVERFMDKNGIVREKPLD